MIKSVSNFVQHQVPYKSARLRLQLVGFEAMRGESACHRIDDIKGNRAKQTDQMPTTRPIKNRLARKKGFVFMNMMRFHVLPLCHVWSKRK